MAARWTRALVTGASSGLGAAFSAQLAAEGTDLVIVARRQDRLESLAASLHERHGVTVEVIAADLADQRERTKVEARLGDVARPVDLLINNAGLGTGGAFQRSRLDLEQRSIELAVTTPLRLIHAVLPGMLDRGGAILNVSSLAAFLASPWGPSYAAGKMFQVVFTEAMAEQLHASRVTMTVACPGFIDTEFPQRTEATGSPVVTYPSFLEMAPERVAELCLTATERGVVRVVPGLGNRLIVLGVNALPAGVRRFVIGRVSRARSPG